MMNSYAYEEKLKRIKVYQNWLQEKQKKDLAAQRKQAELLCRLCDLQLVCGCEDTFLSSEISQTSYQKMIFLWSNCKEMKDYFAEESKDIQNLLAEYAEFVEDIQNGWKYKGTGKRSSSESIYLAEENKELLQKKLEKGFAQNFYLADIAINDQEYEFLLNYTKDVLKGIKESKETFRNDVLIVTFMVQVAIRHYKGKYWGAFFEQIKSKMEPALKSFLEKTLIYTLQKNNKYIVNKNERLNTIFFHAFLGNYYANAWFELLLGYYLNDLNSNIADHNKNRYHYFLQGLVKAQKENEDFPTSKENADDTYLLRHGSIIAMTANEDLSFIKVTQALQLIHNALKFKTLGKKSKERVQNLFLEWSKDSYAFKRAFNEEKKVSLNIRLCADLNENKFYLSLPPRSVAAENTEKSLYWQVRTNRRLEKITPESKEIFSGIASEPIEMAIGNDEIFGRIKAELFLGEEKVDELLFKGEKLRLFDENGVYCAELHCGEMYAYTNKETTVQSFALEKRLDLPGLIRYQLNCADDEVLVINNYEVRILGHGYEEGLNSRGKIENMTAIGENGRSLAVYGDLPVLSITVQANKINASSIIINSSRYNLRSCRLLEFEKPDSKGVKIVLVDLRDMPSFKDGKVNRLSVDIIASNSLKSYSFVYCQGLNLHFSPEMSIFAKEAMVKFAYAVNFRCRDKYVQKLEPNTFSFALSDYDKALNFTLDKEKLDFVVQMPMALVSVDQESWHNHLPENLLANKLPEKLYFKNIAADELIIELAERFSWKAMSENGIFTFDLLPLLAALNYFTDSAELKLLVGENKYELFRIHLYDYVYHLRLACDYQTDDLILKCAVKGDGQYYADIMTNNSIICHRQHLEQGSLTVKADNLLEKFTVYIYQKMPNEEYQLIYSQKLRPYSIEDLSDCQVLIKGFALKLNSEESNSFAQEYVLYNLKESDDNIYTASLGKRIGEYYCAWLEKVEAEFYFDTIFSKGYLTFYDAEDECFNDFLYDSKNNTLAVKESDEMANEEKYSRYKMMFDDNCVYQAQVLPAAEALKNAQAAENYPLEKLGLEKYELSALEKAGYKNLAEIDADSLAEKLADTLLKEELLEKIAELKSILER